MGKGGSRTRARPTLPDGDEGAGIGARRRGVLGLPGRRSRGIYACKCKAKCNRGDPAGSRAWLQRLIVAALETCCRRGELLSLRWRDVDLRRGEITIRAEHAKDREMRRLPISPRLRGVLEMARHDPAGREHGPDAYVFGDRIGRRVADPKKAWATTVLRAHGFDPEWNQGHAFGCVPCASGGHRSALGTTSGTREGLDC